MSDQMLTKAQLADRWGCTERHVQELWTRREIDGLKIGRLVRFPVEGVERYEAARTASAKRGPLARTGAA